MNDNLGFLEGIPDIDVDIHEGGTLNPSKGMLGSLSPLLQGPPQWGNH